MSDRYDEDTVRLVAGKVFTWTNEDDLGLIRSVLDALADAGLLLPPGGEKRDEWAVWWHSATGGIAMSRYEFGSRGRAEEVATKRIGQYGITHHSLHRRTWTTWPDGSAHCTALMEVTDA